MKYLSLCLVSCAIAMTGCSKESPKTATAIKPLSKPIAAKRAAPKPAPKPAVTLAVGGEAANVYTTRCALCHGDGGLGDGIAAASSPVKPRTFAEAAWQTKVTDDHIKKVIVEGGSAVGLSALMAGNTDLKDKPEVLDGLVKIIRGFKE